MTASEAAGLFTLGFLLTAGFFIASCFWSMRRMSRNDLRNMKPINSGIKPGQWITMDPSEPKPEKGWRAPPVDSTLGWRGWNWNPHEKCLQSPAYHALWRDGECRVEHWDKGDAVRGVAGIHALWPVPPEWQNKDGNFGSFPVVGIVERYGHYVLGEDGWRAEWVIVRELAAHKSIIEEVRKAYPGLTVHERVCKADSFSTTTVNAAQISKLMWPGINALQQQQAQALAQQMQNTIQMNANMQLNALQAMGLIRIDDQSDTPPGCTGDPIEMP